MPHQGVKVGQPYESITTGDRRMQCDVNEVVFGFENREWVSEDSAQS